MLKAIWAPLRMPDGSSVLPVLKRLRADVLEAQLQWSVIAPRRPRHPTDPHDPAYHWPRDLDQAARNASRYGIQLALLAQDTPGWANGGRSPQWAPDRPSDYADFLVAAARHYPQVRRWMIWGEVNRGVNFLPMPVDSPVGPRRYARVLAAAYSALKAHDPREVVVGGMTYTYGAVKPPDFVRWLRLPSGSPPPLDEWGHNPYSRRRPALHAPLSFPRARDMSDLPRLAGEVHGAYSREPRFHDAGPPLWLSEFSVSSDRRNRAFDFFVSRAVQARWLQSAFQVAAADGFVTGLGWFNLLDDPPSRSAGLSTGLMTASGQEKPAFEAFRRVP